VATNDSAGSPPGFGRKKQTGQTGHGPPPSRVVFEAVTVRGARESNLKNGVCRAKRSADRRGGTPDGRRCARACGRACGWTSAPVATSYRLETAANWLPYSVQNRLAASPKRVREPRRHGKRRRESSGRRPKLQTFGRPTRWIRTVWTQTPRSAHTADEVGRQCGFPCAR